MAVKAITDVDNTSNIDNTKLFSKEMMKLVGKRIAVGVVITVAVAAVSSAMLAVSDKLTPDNMDSIIPES